MQWNRVRAPPLATPAHDLHASDCLEELRPGDHFEIQWRKNKDFPYGMYVCVYFAPLRSSTKLQCWFGSRTTARCLCDAPQQAGGMASWVTRSRATGTSICVAATKTVKILYLSLFSPRLVPGGPVFQFSLPSVADTVILEFQHYAPGSRWRQTTVGRKDHREKGDETDGFYGGIRKLHTKDEISTWRRFWPVDVLN